MSVESIEVEQEGGEGDGEEQSRAITDQPPQVLAVATLFALIIAGLTVYASMNLTQAVSAGIAVVVGGASWYHLAHKPSPSIVAGSGSYITALILIITPFSLYLPDVVLRGEEIQLFAEGVEASDVQIGGGVLFEAGALSMDGLSQGNVDGLLSLIVWAVVFMMMALGLFVLGKILKSAGKKRHAG